MEHSAGNIRTPEIGPLSVGASAFLVAERGPLQRKSSWKRHSPVACSRPRRTICRGWPLVGAVAMGVSMRRVADQSTAFPFVRFAIVTTATRVFPGFDLVLGVRRFAGDDAVCQLLGLQHFHVADFNYRMLPRVAIL